MNKYSNTTTGNDSPIINGDNTTYTKGNNNNTKVSFGQKIKIGSIGFIAGVLASLLANWIWSILK